MARFPIPSDTAEFDEETRAAVRHIQQTRKSMPPPSSYLTYAGKAGALLSDLVEHLRYHTSLTDAETELAICTAVRAANADYIWDAHVRLGLQAGTREEAIHAVDTYGADHSLRAGVAGCAPSQRRDVWRGAGSVWREGSVGTDCPDGRVHDERNHPPRDGSSGGGGRAAFDATVAPGASRGGHFRGNPMLLT